MQFLKRLLTATALLVPMAYGAEDSFLFKATVYGLGADTIPVAVSLSSNSVKTVDLGNELALEFTAPGRSADGAQTMVRLLRQQGDEFRLLHTTHQSLVEGAPMENAYLVCGERLTFMSPPPATLPECSATTNSRSTQ
ncbi:MAG: hypothetical protein LBF16_15030 [Pseudomonadales bacterium]|jgi:hypothetical protein|nr:hypothetical protein [Pseudomonadales bacterium]